MEQQTPEDGETVLSALDELTHTELRLLYEESATAIRFAKAQQWKSVGATLLVFVALIALADYVSRDSLFVRSVALVSIGIGIGSIYTISLYQYWQNTERAKLRAIADQFSSIFRDVRAIKSSLEADIHRYTLLAFMVALVVIGNATVIASAAKYLP